LAPTPSSLGLQGFLQQPAYATALGLVFRIVGFHAAPVRLGLGLIKLELAEIGRTPQCEQPDPLLRLAHVIDEAEKRHTIYRDHAKLCRDLLKVIRMARASQAFDRQ